MISRKLKLDELGRENEISAMLKSKREDLLLIVRPQDVVSKIRCQVLRMYVLSYE